MIQISQVETRTRALSEYESNSDSITSLYLPNVHNKPFVQGRKEFD